MPNTKGPATARGLASATSLSRNLCQPNVPKHRDARNAGKVRPHSSVTIWPKDLGIVLEIAGEAGFAAPVTQAALAQFMEAAEQGLSGEDDAAVAKVYAGQVGVTLPGEG